MTTGCVKMIEKMKNNFQKLENCDDDDDDDKEEILPLEMTHLTPALIEEARFSLNETEEVKQKALAKLRRMIEAEKDLTTPTDDLFLKTFLRARKFNVKRAFKLLQNYWIFRKDYNKIYSMPDIESGVSLLLRSYLGLLEYRDKNGCAVFVAKIGKWDPEIDSFENMFRAVTGVLLYAMEHEATSIAGIRAIIDVRGITWAQMKYLTPSNVLTLIRSTQFCFPARYKGVHILAESKMLNFVWTLTYPFLTAKLKKRVFLHGEDTEPLLEYIHPSVLPEEFGGQAPPFDNTSRTDLIKDRVHSILDLLNYGYKD